MPSRYSSDGSITDAELLAANLGIDARMIAIEPAHEAFTAMLAESFAGRAPDLTEENLQSRIRGVTLMALSNKLGWLVLTTGNKSESAVGYSTLYGDTAGGFAVIKDVPKLLVYRLCRCPQRSGRSRADPRVRARRSRRRPSCARISATTRACRPTSSSIPSSRPTSRTTAPPRSWSRWASTRRSSSASSA